MIAGYTLGVRSFLALAAAVGACVVGACAVRPAAPMAGQRAADVAGPFAPAALSIHPLTRVDRDDKGVVWIICHVELRDAWGDPCKGTGKLQVQLYKPVGGRASGLGSQELTWDIDLSALDKNASFYDPPTRTYRFALQNAPAWVADVLDPNNHEARVRLRAVLSTTGPKGEPKFLQDEYTIGG